MDILRKSKIASVSYLISVIICLLLILTASAKASEKEDWYDKNYDFKSIDSVAVYDIDFSNTNISEIKELNFKDKYRECAKKPNYRAVFDPPYPPEESVKVAKAYIVATLKQCDVKEEYYEGYVSWRLRPSFSLSFPHSWHGHHHRHYRHRGPHVRVHMVPDYDYTPPHNETSSVVEIEFKMYDSATGKLIASRNERRVRKGSGSIEGVYGRIVESFFNDLKHRTEK